MRDTSIFYQKSGGRQVSFTSFEFLLILLPVTLVIYWVAGDSKRILQNIILMVASFVFYSSYDFKYLIFLLLSIGITYISGIYISEHEENTGVYYGAIIANLSMLIIFKYTGFVLGNLNLLLQYIGITITPPKLLLPIGLSFYIFQSSTYLFDLKNKRIDCEKNIINYTVFVSFFATIISGPIQRSYKFLPQIRNRRVISFSEIQMAILTFLYGAFIKMVIADRIAIFTNEVYNNYSNYNGIIFIICALLYSLQIYADFAGYSYMAIAIAAMFGFQFEDNFRQPYLATNIQDFWRRWHISLTSWFTDYLYIPLGGNRKGIRRQYINILIVFLVSGLWHGAAWNFVLWGALHGIYQIIGKVTLKKRIQLCDKLKVNRETVSYQIYQRVFIYLTTSFAWIFFRVPDMKELKYVLKSIFTEWNPWILFDKTMSTIGLSHTEWHILIIVILIMILVSILREKKYNCQYILHQNISARVLIFIVLLLSIVIFGIYGESYSASSFIYAGF